MDARVKPGHDELCQFLIPTHSFAISPRSSREVCWKLFILSLKRERGMPGARCTRGLVCNCARNCAHEHTGSAESIRHPPRNGFTAYGVLSSATNSVLPPSPAD